MPPKTKAPPAVLWPCDVAARYNVSAATRWRWERIGRLPPRDVDLNGKTGWRRDTIETFEQRRDAEAV